MGATRLFGAHEVGETLPAFWDDALDYRAQVSGDAIYVEGTVWGFLWAHGC